MLSSDLKETRCLLFQHLGVPMDQQERDLQEPLEEDADNHPKNASISVPSENRQQETAATGSSPRIQGGQIIKSLATRQHYHPY